MVLFVSLLTACSAPRPAVEAHRAGAGYFPENSRLGVTSSLELGFDGVEVDLVLTADGVPVFSHEPWVEPSRCEHRDGTVFDEPVRIDSLELEFLQETYLCGGAPDPAFPNAILDAEPLMALDEMLELLGAADVDTLVHLDIKAEPGLTPPAEDFAEAVLGRWFDADRPQPLLVSAGPPDTLTAFENWGRRNGHEVPTALVWPLFPRGEDATSVGLAAELAVAAGTRDPVAEVEEAEADGLVIQWELARREQVARAQSRGLFVALWTLNEPELLRVHSRWPVDALITDYPGDLP